jgi:4-azaleucine resistance transporter AzlC
MKKFARESEGIKFMNKGTKQAFQYVVPKTIPVLVGYLFLGAAYGILMQVNGFGIGWTLISSIFIYAGSLQYLEVTLLAGLVSPVYAFLMGLMINARQLFYGISLLNKYRDVKKGKPYLIFALTDETFSVICDENVPETLEQDKVFFWITFLDQCYWVMGSAVGALVGGFLTFNTQGLDFALTALFVVIFTDQWKHQKNHRPALIGLLGSAACVVVFGASAFLIPAMLVIILALTCGYKRKKRVERGIR